MIVHNHLSKIFQKPARIEQGSFLENCYSVVRKIADKAMKYLVWSKLELGVRNVFWKLDRSLGHSMHKPC